MKETTIEVRCTDEQKKLIKANAELEGFSMSKYILLTITDKINNNVQTENTLELLGKIKLLEARIEMMNK